MTLATSPFAISQITNGVFYFDSSDSSAPRFEVRFNQHIVHLRIIYNTSLCDKIEALFKNFKADVTQHFHSPKCRMCRKEYESTATILKVMEYIRANNTFKIAALVEFDKLLHQCRLDG